MTSHAPPWEIKSIDAALENIRRTLAASIHEDDVVHSDWHVVRNAFLLASDQWKSSVAQHVAEAVAAETERCARIIEVQDIDPSFRNRMVTAIRARADHDEVTR